MTEAKRILVIEDNFDIAEIVCSTAESLQMTCTIADNRDAVVAALESQPALIVMDMKMPGMTGLEVIELLRVQQCRAHIVLMSGVGRAVMEDAAKLAESLGLEVVGLLAKPFRGAELIEMLGR